MSVRTFKPNKHTSYFCTFTNYQWISLFEQTNFYNKIYDWFHFLTKRGDQIIGYCIMPNHLHCIIYLHPDSASINEVIGEAKRLMSYSIVAKLKKQNATSMLEQLQSAVSTYEKDKGIKHKVFEDSFDCKECYTYEFIQQKLQYMHYNSVEAGLTSVPEDYIHSSAKYYVTSIQALFPVTHYADIYEERKL